MDKIKTVYLQNRYRLESSLGKGGMANVYRALDTSLNVPVAVKEMVPQPNLEPEMLASLRQQFRQEAQLLAKLWHPNLVRITNYFEEDGKSYLVMDLIEGENLAQLIKREGRAPESVVLRWAGQLLDALDYCHSQQIVHRDIKPQNIIIRPDGQAVLVDFGLVKLWDPYAPETHTVMRGMGTPEYAPPEQYDVSLGHTDPYSDIYGLGATLYHALTGEVPPTATNRIAYPELYGQSWGVMPEVSDRTQQAIRKSLALARLQRWPTAKTMSLALGLTRSAEHSAQAIAMPQTAPTPQPVLPQRQVPYVPPPRLVQPGPVPVAAPHLRHDTMPETGSPELPKRRRFGFWAWAMIVVVVGVMGTGGYFVGKTLINDTEDQPVIVEAVLTTATITPTNAALPAWTAVVEDTDPTASVTPRATSTLKPTPLSDRDGDGWVDSADGCPDTPAGACGLGGCPDRDCDGVLDKVDLCPDLKTDEEGENGCPGSDADGDGVLDIDDECPATYGDSDYYGCPAPDADNDGIPDSEDVCPVVKGPPEHYGCPPPQTDSGGDASATSTPAPPDSRP